MKEHLEKIEFFKIGDYIHQYYVEGLHDRLQSFQPLLDKTFDDGIKNPILSQGRANFDIIDKEFHNVFDEIFYFIINKFYLVDKNWSNMRFGVYKQDKNHHQHIYHTHITQTTLTAVTYLNPPNTIKEGGGLDLILPPELPQIINVKKDFIYFFPSWLLHRPVPQTISTPRYSINWGYNCSKRPIHKLTGERW